VKVFRSGCTSGPVHHANEALIVFDRVATEDVVISEVHSYENGDELVIYGKVKCTAYNCCDAASGRVAITVVSGAGELIGLVRVLYGPRNIPKIRSRTSHFITRLPYFLPDVTTLRITYYDGLEISASTRYADNMFLSEQYTEASDNQG